MKKLDWIKVILILSIFVNISLIMNHKRENRAQEIKYELLNAYIYRDLAQLEETIQYQIKNNWNNESLIIQKLDDSIDSIILHLGMESDDDKEAILWKLHDYMNMFKIGDGTIDVGLNDNQRANYIYLYEKLRSSGWTFNAGYDTNWDTFASRVNEFVTES